MIYCFRSLLCKAIFVSLVFVIYSCDTQEVLDVKNDTSAAETLFKRLYKLERSEQLAAVKALLKIEKPDRQKKMLEAIAAKVLHVIKGCKLILEDESFVPGESEFPSDERIRDALANVLENTAFLGDIIVRLPSLSLTVLKQKPEWLSLLQWSIHFTNQSGLIDLKTTKLLSLVSQEMNFSVRTSDFKNPYTKEKMQIQQEEPNEKKKIKKKKNIPKGPRLSSRQFGEL